jgi:hypothetical protein
MQWRCQTSRLSTEFRKAFIFTMMLVASLGDAGREFGPMVLFERGWWFSTINQWGLQRLSDDLPYRTGNKLFWQFCEF